MTLGERGRRLFDAYQDIDPAQMVVLEEACRLADRLDRLDALLQGDADVWCRLVHQVRTEDYELRIDSALSEARQQALALASLLSGLTAKKGSDDDGDGADDWLDQLHPSLRNSP